MKYVLEMGNLKCRLTCCVLVERWRFSPSCSSFRDFLKKRHTEHCASTTVTAHLSCALGICCFFKLVSNRDHKSEVRTKLWLLCILSCTLQVNVKTKPASLGHILVSRHQTNKLLQCNRRWERSCGLQRSTQRSLVYFQESVSHWRGSVTALLLYQCCAPEWDT